jgi:hypothetical protein
MAFRLGSRMPNYGLAPRRGRCKKHTHQDVRKGAYAGSPRVDHSLIAIRTFGVYDVSSKKRTNSPRPTNRTKLVGWLTKRRLLMARDVAGQIWVGNHG